MKYQDALKYLYSQLPMYQRVGPVAFKKDLGNIRALLSRLGHPEKKFPSVHIAGTNGKGSVSHILAAAFQAHGFRVGLYTSPHYTDFRERIKINGSLIPKRRVSRFVEKCLDDWNEINPSFFEMTVALAFDHFAREKVDIAIVETGLGGRLDSTNVLSPLLSVITNIDYDHMDMLGDTLPEIAGEKAGIIKHGIPVVLGQRVPETEDVFVRKAHEMHASYFFAEAHVEIRKEKQTRKFQYFSIRNGIGYQGIRFKTDLLGPFQLENIRTSLTAIDVFREHHPDWGLSRKKTLASLSSISSSTYFIGRWQYLDKQPDIICDSGHNVHALNLVLNDLEQASYKVVHAVLGFSSGKDIQKMLSAFPRRFKLYLSKPDVARGVDASEVGEVAGRLGYDHAKYESVKDALWAARKSAGKNDLVFVGGSVFVVAEVLEIFGY